MQLLSQIINNCTTTGENSCGQVRGEMNGFRWDLHSDWVSKAVLSHPRSHLLSTKVNSWPYTWADAGAPAQPRLSLYRMDFFTRGSIRMEAQEWYLASIVIILRKQWPALEYTCLWGVTANASHIPGRMPVSCNSILPCASSALTLTWKDKASNTVLFMVRLRLFLKKAQAHHKLFLPKKTQFTLWPYLPP